MLKKKITQLGIDKAISFTIAGRVTQAFGSLFSIILIGTYLDSNEQGYFYTFGSILAIQVFFELGLTNIITQYVAHEKAMLQWSNIILIGSDKSLYRLSSILRLTIKWYSSVAVLLLVTLVVIGFVFFQRFSQSNLIIEWKLPWILLVCGACFSLIITAILAFYEGLEKAEECAKIRMLQQLTQISVLICSLILGAKLYSTGIAMLVSSIFVISWVSFSRIRLKLINIWYSNNSDYVINWKREVLPYQWRIAVSWMSGYFIFQLFNPILFATEGPVIAGQMGMTMAIIQGINTIASAWLRTKVPTFSVMIAQKRFMELNLFFSTTLRQALLSLFVGSALLLMTLFFLSYQKVNIMNRFLPFIPVYFLLGSSFLQMILDAMATYLRCHKKEPFLLLSIFIGLLTSLTIYIVSKPYGVIGVTSAYFIILLFATLWGYKIFNLKRHEWHK